MSKTLLVSAMRSTLRTFAEHLLEECDKALDPTSGVVRENIKVELNCEHNGSGPDLVIRFDNDDMETNDLVEDGQALWDDDE